VVSADQFLCRVLVRRLPEGTAARQRGAGKAVCRTLPCRAIDWPSALGRSGPRWPGDVWYRMLSLPATWVTVYPESVALPRLSTSTARRTWLEAQAELGQRLTSLGLGLDRFSSGPRATTSVVDSGREAAILAVGRGTIACIERDVVTTDTLSGSLRRVYGSAAQPLFWQEDAPARLPRSLPASTSVLR